MGELRRFTRNSFFLALSDALRFAAGVLVTVFVGKHLAKEDFGRLSFALTLSIFFGTLADFGLPALTTRDVAQDRSLAARYYRNIIVLKALLAIAGFLAIVAYMHFLGYPAETRAVVYPVTAYMLIASLGTYHYFVFRGLERMHLEAAAAIVNNAALIICVGAALGPRVILSGHDVNVPVGRVAAGYLVAGVVSTMLVFALFGRTLGGVRPGFDFALWKRLLKKATMFALYGFFGLIYMYVDTLMIEKLRNSQTEVASYQAPVKLLTAAVMVLAVIINVYLPMLSRRYRASVEDFRSLVHTLNHLGLAIIVPIAAFSFVYAREILVFAYKPDYGDSAAILQVLTVGFLAWYGPPYAVVFLAMDRQAVTFHVSAVCAVVNFVLNWIFIPGYGPIAAAATTLATYVLMKALYMGYCRKYLGSTFVDTRYLTTALLCAAIAFALKQTGLHVVPAGALFCAIYAAGCYLLLLSRGERKLCTRLLGTLTGREAAA